jgi:hypothetical protein
MSEQKIDNMVIDRSIYQRDDGEFTIERGQMYLSERPQPRIRTQPIFQQAPATSKPVPHSHVSMKTYNEQNPKWWSKLCCSGDAEVAPDFDDCEYCKRRVYKDESDSDDDAPYMSQQRMKQRAQQPINTFCDRL